MKAHHILLLIFIALQVLSCNNAPDKKAGKEEAGVYMVSLSDKKDICKEDFFKTITLDSLKKEHLLDFGEFTTESTIAFSRGNAPDSLLFSQHKKPGEKQVIDITTWGKGTYRVQFTANAESLAFWLEVK
ncbi:MAG: hypothetical protein BWY70_00431 [Bacteroidetes bacterium ADurb.Bin408]|nr:MAG: hypothetical protein BWY70_00431 [Bacteroidetes bacterium ADurb.Bin408]